MNTHTAHRWLLLGSLIATSSSTKVAQGQEAALPLGAFASPEAVAAADPAQAWRNDARLSAKITLEAKRMPLAQVLTALSKPTGISFDAGALSTAKRVTLSVKGMDVRDVMIALAQLYQANWQAQDDKPQGEQGYVLQEQALQPWQRSLAQLGNPEYWGFYRSNNNWSRPYAPPYLTAEYAFDWDGLLQNLDIEELKSPEGVPFSSLLEDTQKEIRRVTSWDIKHQAVEAIATREAGEHDFSLSIMPENYIPQGTLVDSKVRIPVNYNSLVGYMIVNRATIVGFPVAPVLPPQAPILTPVNAPKTAGNNTPGQAEER